jgi:hypothetical protein
LLLGRRHVSEIERGGGHQPAYVARGHVQVGYPGRAVRSVEKPPDAVPDRERIGQ